MAGTTRNYTSWTTNAALARYNPDGSLDSSFGSNGKIITASRTAYTLVLQPDGKMVTAGSTNALNERGRDFILARYNPNGSLDSTFGNEGSVSLDIFDNSDDYVSGLVIQPDGKIVAAGSSSISGISYNALARYNQNGSLDGGFGSGGKVTTVNVSNSGYLVLQPDGKLVMGGSSPVDYSGLIMQGLNMTRYNSNGSLDLDFGNGGMITTVFTAPNTATPVHSNVYGLVIQPDGKLVAAGNTYNPVNYNNGGFMARYIWKTNAVPSANAGPDLAGDEGQQLTFDGSGSTDPDGQADIVSYNWDFGDVGTASGAVVSHTYADNGIYTATLTVTDTAGQTNSDTAAVTVNNAAPVIGSLSPISSVLPGISINTSANFTDPGTLDTHAAAFDWGDGTVAQGLIIEANGSGSVSGSHTYSAPGVYTITLTVIDKDGGVASNSISVTILTPVQAAQNLIDLVETFNLQQGIENSLDVKLDNAINAMSDLNANNDQAAINSLQAFINAVEAQRGNHITNAQADQLIHDAQQILNSLYFLGTL